MISRAPKHATSGPLANSGFRKAEPLTDGQRALSEREIREVFASFFQARAADMADSFSDARSRLREEYGACVEIVEKAGGGLKFSARLEFLTEDRSLDADLNQKVSGRGFSLKLHSVPITEGPVEERFERRVRMDGMGRKIEYTEQRMLRKYVITEGERTSRIDCAPRAAEDLLKLAASLRPAGISEDMPRNVLPFEAARPSRPPQKPARAEPLADGPAKMQGGKAS